MKLLAIDGNSIINRAFYGIKLLSTKEGRYTNAVYGFINILNKLLESEHPDGVAVAFDLKKPTFRHIKYEAYKAGRHAMPEELVEQFPVLKQWLSLAGYHCVECEGFEADDILGTLSYACENSGNECVIATGDRDSLQLISNSTRVLLAATRAGKPEIVNYDKAALFEKYGLAPEQMIELKALMGDSSDNIPGVAGVGEKTALDLIKRFDNIDNIYENIDSIDVKEGVRAKLKSGKENAYLSRFIGTIVKDVPIDTNPESYIVSKPDRQALSRLMTELEFYKLMDKMGLTPSVKAETETKKTVKKSLSVCDFKEVSLSACADVFSVNGEFACVCKDKIFSLTRAEAEEILINGSIEKRVYDLKNLKKDFPEAVLVKFDAMLAGYILNPSSKDYSLKRLCAEYSCDTPEIIGEASEVITETALFSSVCDRLEENLVKTKQDKLFYDIEVPLAEVLSDMESVGFLVDTQGLCEEGRQLSERIDGYKNEIYGMAGEEFNINSPKQLGEILFEKLKIPAKKKTKSGYSTSVEVLESLRYEYPIVDSVLKYRQLAKLKSTYCDGLAAAVSDDGRIHSTFNQTEARTGRISSLEPNLQNIPVRTAEGRKLREFFIARDGFVLCDADYSQIELRVLASIADDEVMIKAFNDGKDIHTITASEVFDIPPDMVLPVMRSRAKAVNFGIVYGIGAFSLSKDIGVSRAEADRYIKGYLSTYPGVSRYMDEVIKKAKADGFVTTLFGRRRYLPELSSSNGMMRAFGERVARNAPIQGTAADIIKLAMINVSRRLKEELPEARLILQVHDELIVESPEKDAAGACEILRSEMENAVNLKVKLCADVHTGKNWLEAKG
mgnify:CR=1 FL=1